VVYFLKWEYHFGFMAFYLRVLFREQEKSVKQDLAVYIDMNGGLHASGRRVAVATELLR
jgi:hypothetical protein